MCSNENCGMEINKQDKDHHENEVCKYRKVKCQDCGKTQEVVGRLEGSLMGLGEKFEDVENDGEESWRRIEKNHENIKRIVGKLGRGLVGIIDKKVEAMTNRQNELQREAKREVGEIKKEVKDVKENLSKVNKDVDEVKVMMSQVLEKLTILDNFNKLPSSTEGVLNTPREDILIAGGYDDGTGTEIFSCEKDGWFEVSPMNEEHAGASSLIYKGNLFVVGGVQSKTIETLDLSVLPLKWMKCPGKLPYACGVHQTVVYQERVIHIGGFDYNKRERSNVISELQLTSPYNVKELCQMPEPREHHRAKVFKDKVFIMGGEKSWALKDRLDSVLEFDVKTSKYKEMPPLPCHLTRMATVQWRDQVVVLGGQDKDGKVLNDVFMYECFTIGGSTWKYLSAMNEARFYAVAEVLPSTRKYV